MSATETPVVDVLETLRTAVLANGGKEEDLRLLALPGVSEDLAKTLVQCAKLLSDIRPVTVDYGSPQSDEERAQLFTAMIAACGFDYVNPNITVANFPLSGTVQVEEEIIVLHFNRDIGSEAVIAEMAKLGLEPARLEHACAFGKKYPDVQREYPIVFLGSSCLVDGHRHVPCLYGYDSLRRLYLHCFDYGWHGLYRFAAVRTKKTK